MFFRLIMFGVNHRVTTFLFIVLVTFATGLGIPKLRVDTGFNNLIPQSNPEVPIYDRIVQEFGSDNRTIVYIRDAIKKTVRK